jgi:hypothetical protein
VLGGDLKDIETTIKNPDIKHAIIDFAKYNAILLFCMIALGRVARSILLLTNLHTRNEIYNLYNKWWYFFNGNYGDIENYDLVFVDAVVDTKDGTMIYSGFLVNFETNGGELDRIYLKDTVRREFKKQAGDARPQFINEPGEPMQVPGATFSIKYSNVINLNVNFLLIKEEQNLQENDTPNI